MGKQTGQIQGIWTRHIRTGININNAVNDVGTISGLPAKYQVLSFKVFDSSANLGASAAALGVFTAAGGGGTTVITAATLTALTAAAKFTSMALAGTPGTDYLTAATLYIRNTAAHGSAATVSCILEIVDLTGTI